MGFDGEIRINTEINTDKANKSTEKLNDTIKGTSKNLNETGESAKVVDNRISQLGKTIATAFSVTALLSFGKKAVEMASNLQEVQNVVDTAFGSMSYKIEEFAETSIESFGLSELSAKKTASTFMAMGTGMDITKGKASDMAIALTGLTADMSSFYNVSQDVAETALASIYTGETESLKKFGIVMTEVNLQQFAYTQGITKQISEMSQAEKVQLRYNFVLDKTKLAQGDFAKTSESWANQTRVLTERFKELMTMIGEDLLEALTPMVEVLNNIVQAFIDFGKWCDENTATIEIFTGVLLAFLAELSVYYTSKVIKNLFFDMITALVKLTGLGMITSLEELKIAFFYIKDSIMKMAGIDSIKSLGDLRSALSNILSILKANALQSIATAGAFAVLTFAFVEIVKAWGNMSGAERIISVLGAMAIAAGAAAIALGALTGPMGAVLAVGSIAVGLTTVLGLTQEANRRAQEQLNRSSQQRSPGFASGGVFKGGRPMLGYLNDQPYGQTNIETPLETMVQAFNTSLDNRGGSGGNVTIRFTGNLSDIARVLKPQLDAENLRVGTSLVVEG